MKAENNRYIIDASSILCFLLPDESDTNIDVLINQFYQGEVFLYTSPICTYEVGNGLKSAVRRKRIAPHIATALFQNILELRIPEITVAHSETLQIALQYELTYYDATYVCCAKKYSYPLISKDKKQLATLAKELPPPTAPPHPPATSL